MHDLDAGALRACSSRRNDRKALIVSQKCVPKGAPACQPLMHQTHQTRYDTLPDHLLPLFIVVPLTFSILYSPIFGRMLPLLLALSASKALHATPKTLKGILGQNPFTVLLITSPRCQPCKRIQTAMDGASAKFAKSVTFAFIEIDNAPEIAAKYNVSFAPRVMIFKGDKFVQLYLGDWTQNGFTTFCEKLIKFELHHLKTVFDVFEFQRLAPSNLLLVSKANAAKADEMLEKYGGIVNIGVLENESVALELKLPPAQFTRVDDFVTFDFEDVTEKDVDAHMWSPYEHIHSHEWMGICPTPLSFLTLLDERDPMMIHDTARDFDALRELFGSNVSFQFCDFFTCANVVQQLKIGMYTSPVLMCREQMSNGRYRLDPLPKVPATKEDVINFGKFKVWNIEPPRKKTELRIPKLSAHDFIQNVIDPKMDVILLLAAPRMQLYEQSQKNIRALMTAFEGIDTVRFFEFNTITEHVQGLQLPESDKPQISIWPATEQPGGSAFAAYLPINVIFENLLKLITTKVSQQKMDQMLEAINQYMQAASE